MRRPWVLLALTLGSLAACGGDEDGKAPSVTLPAGKPLGVVAREYSFDPEKVVVERPGELRITLGNEGRLAHDIRLIRDDEDVGGTPAFEEGRRTARVRLSRGRYEFVCSVGDHKELGMAGTLEVR